MRSARIRATLALLLLILYALAFGKPAAAYAGANAEPSGRLELTVLSGSKDVCAECTAMATNMSTGHTAMLTMSPSGTLTAELPAGTYMVIVMPPGGIGSPSATPTGQIGAVLPAMLNVVIVAGQTARETVVMGGPIMPDEFDASQFEELFDLDSEGGHPQAADVDLDAVIADDELVALARRYHDLYWGRLTFSERSLVESLTWRMDIRSGGAAPSGDVEEITTAAAAIAAPGASRSASVVLAARAVMEMPDLGLALNNFGAMLRLLGEISDSVVVLRAARAVDPESPMILTNLANSVRELGDLRLAESLYLEALRAGDEFGPALSALGDMYMARGDYEKAVDMLMRGSKMGFCTAVNDSLVDALDQAYGDSDQVPPRPPDWDSNDSPASAIGVVPLVAQHGHPVLVLPRFGNWGSVDSLAGSMEPLAEIMSRIAVERSSAVQQDVNLKRQRMATANPRDYEIPGTFPLRFEKQLLHLRLIKDYFWKTAVQAIDRATEQADPDASRERYVSMMQRYALRMAAAGSEQEAREIAAEFCAEAAAFANREFAKNKPIWAAMNTAVVAAIEDYWAFCQPVLDSIYDPITYKLAELDRRITAYSMIQMAYDQTLALAAMPISHFECGNCGGTGKATAPVGDADVPPDPDDKCPFKGGSKFSLSLGPIDYSVTCTTVEIGFAAGTAASLTWDFKNKRVTQIFVGVGVQSGVGPARLGRRFGAQVTFDPDGSVSDISGAASGSVSLGPVSPGVSTNGGLVVGLPFVSIPVGR
ncbi:MAG TPA: tetratricopeptide repeat protein [Bacillota bacterium]|nr:tetratricopeptide repeat protein [Bacillota bacterium]